MEKHYGRGGLPETVWRGHWDVKVNKGIDVSLLGDGEPLFAGEHEKVEDPDARLVLNPGVPLLVHDVLGKRFLETKLVGVDGSVLVVDSGILLRRKCSAELEVQSSGRYQGFNEHVVWI